MKSHENWPVFKAQLSEGYVALSELRNQNADFVSNDILTYSIYAPGKHSDSVSFRFLSFRSLLNNLFPAKIRNAADLITFQE